MCRLAGHAGAAALAVTLRDNSCLTRLNLTNNALGNAGCESLAAALQTNAAVAELYLSLNNIGEVGAVALARAFTDNTTLHIVGLKRNDIGRQGMEIMGSAIGQRRALRLAATERRVTLLMAGHPRLGMKSGLQMHLEQQNVKSRIRRHLAIMLPLPRQLTVWTSNHWIGCGGFPHC